MSLKNYDKIEKVKFFWQWYWHEFLEIHNFCVHLGEGTPVMRKYSKADILKMAKEEKVGYVRLQFTDILGSIKAVEISVAQLDDALDNKIMFDGS